MVVYDCIADRNTMNSDIILFESLLVLALVWLAWAFWLWQNKERGKGAPAETEPLPVMPLFDMKIDTVVTFEGKRYRIYFEVEDVRMIED